MRRARWKRKNVSAGRSAQAQTSCRRRGKVGNPARRSETETPGPWGTLQPGDVRDTSSFSFRCRWPVVDESLRSGPMRASAPTGRAELAPNTCIPGPGFGSCAVDNDSARTKGGNSCHPGKYSAAGSGRKSRIPVRLQFHIYTSLSPKTILCKKCIKCNMQFLHDIC